jgi:hypothetical protein
VQIVHSSRRGSRDIEHVGSAHDEAELAALKAAAAQRLAAGKTVLDLDLGEVIAAATGWRPLEIISSRAGIGGTRCAAPTTRSASPTRPTTMTCFDSWCWRGS